MNNTGVELIVLTEDEWYDQVYAPTVHRKMNMSVEKFEALIDSGILDVDGPDHCDIIQCLMLRQPKKES